MPRAEEIIGSPAATSSCQQGLRQPPPLLLDAACVPTRNAATVVPASEASPTERATFAGFAGLGPSICTAATDERFRFCDDRGSLGRAFLAGALRLLWQNFAHALQTVVCSGGPPVVQHRSLLTTPSKGNHTASHLPHNAVALKQAQRQMPAHSVASCSRRSQVLQLSNAPPAAFVIARVARA